MMELLNKSVKVMLNHILEHLEKRERIAITTEGSIIAKVPNCSLGFIVWEGQAS